MTTARPRRNGFTLVELLVAVLIFGIMSAMAYGGLNAVLRAREQASVELDRLSEVQRAMLRLERDLIQLVDRPIRDGFGDPRPALVANARNSFPLEFTRRGWRNPLGRPRSSLQRVAYRIEDRRLVRYYWQTLDRPPQTAPQRSELLDDVDTLELRFMDADREWHGQWPPITGSAATAEELPLPASVEVTLELAGWGRIRRQLNVPLGPS